MIHGWSYFQRRKRYGIVYRLRYWAKMQYWRAVRFVAPNKTAVIVQVAFAALVLWLAAGAPR